MNIRSLTTGAAMPTDEASRAGLVTGLGEFARRGRAALEEAGFTVQSTRLSTQPLEQWYTPGSAGSGANSGPARLGQQCVEASLDYVSLGTVQAQSQDADAGAAGAVCSALPAVLGEQSNLFASVQVGDRASGGINLGAVRASASIITALAAQTPDGFGNLRFAAAANCPAHVPFFPASYYLPDERNGGQPEFGLALEAADVAVRAFQDASTLSEARQRLLDLLKDEGGRAAGVCEELAGRHGYFFTGLDISMAPFPSEDRSITRALEMLSGAPLGSAGSLAAAAFFTGVLREARAALPTTGYSGLMLPALEDQTLADRAAEGLVSVETLLLLSSVCGLGLDTVPLPGDVSPEQIEAVIMDMAAMAIRLDKPLTARLLPVPGKAAGEPAEWPDFPYFARGRVMRVPGNGAQAGRGLISEGWLPL